MNRDIKIGIMGCGNMGEAIAKGVVHSGLVSIDKLYLYDIDRCKTDYLKEELKASVAKSAEELANSVDTIIIAVKPQDMQDLLKEIWHVLDSSKLVISIAAGVAIKNIKKNIKDEVRVARVMPNMAALVNQSISVLSYDKYATKEDKELTMAIFKSVGNIVEIEEALIDAVTAISGSGPAYFFYLTEVLERCAVDMGIEKEKAKLLAFGTALGSAALLKQSGIDAETLRKRIMSKGGTTEAAFKVFQKKGLEKILQEGIRAARERAKGLSKGS